MVRIGSEIKLPDIYPQLKSNPESEMANGNVKQVKLNENFAGQY